MECKAIELVAITKEDSVEKRRFQGLIPGPLQHLKVADTKRNQQRKLKSSRQRVWRKTKLMPQRGKGTEMYNQLHETLLVGWLR